jgi:hypothetical protein
MSTQRPITTAHRTKATIHPPGHTEPIIIPPAQIVYYQGVLETIGTSAVIEPQYELPMVRSPNPLSAVDGLVPGAGQVPSVWPIKQLAPSLAKGLGSKAQTDVSVIVTAATQQSEKEKA